LLHSLGHLLGIYLMNIVGILDWVFTEGHSWVKAVVAKIHGAIGHLQGVIVSCKFLQWEPPDPIVLLIIDKVPEVLYD
jgi:hypothetical protein